MPNFNQCVLVGNTSRDVELKYTQRGSAIANLSIAVNRKWRDENGGEKEEVSFLDCVAFGKQAETLGQYVRKGNPILVSGRLKQETWDDKATGQKRSKVVVVVESFQFLGGKRDESTSRPAAPPPGSLAASAGDGDSDSVPF